MLEVDVMPGLSRRAFLGRTAAAVAATSGAGALLAACGDDDDDGGGGSGGTEEVVFLNIVPINSSFAAELIADQNAYFEEEGLEVKMQATRGSAPAIQSVLAGSALITRAGAIETVTAASTQGAPLMNVAMLEHKSPLWFVSTKENPLDEPQDWEGKTMGLPSEGGTSEQTLDVMLKKEGVDADSVERQVVGLSPGTFELVKQGRIDGYTVGSVDGVIFKQQIPEANLLDPSQYVTEGQCYLVSKRTLAEKEDQVLAYLTAIRRSIEEILDDAPEFTKTIRALRKTQDLPELETDRLAKAVLKVHTDSWLLEGQENLMKTVPETWQKVYDQLVEIDVAEPDQDPTQWFTNDLIEKT
jgi:ABC-type nitrate/sulfonate/bicarbonate transport system substrate-binding protein